LRIYVISQSDVILWGTGHFFFPKWSGHKSRLSSRVITAYDGMRDGWYKNGSTWILLSFVVNLFGIEIFSENILRLWEHPIWLTNDKYSIKGFALVERLNWYVSDRRKIFSLEYGMSWIRWGIGASVRHVRLIWSAASCKFAGLRRLVVRLI